MDGVTKELKNYFKSLETLGDKAIQSIKEQIDIESEKLEKELISITPTNTGGLKNSLTKTKIDTDKRYGYILEYQGTNEHGESYAKIANILNYGSSTIKPKRFISKPIKNLKGLDERVSKRFEDKIKDIEN